NGSVLDGGAAVVGVGGVGEGEHAAASLDHRFAGAGDGAGETQGLLGGDIGDEVRVQDDGGGDRVVGGLDRIDRRRAAGRVHHRIHIDHRIVATEVESKCIGAVSDVIAAGALDVEDSDAFGGVEGDASAAAEEAGDSAGGVGNGGGIQLASGIPVTGCGSTAVAL